MSFSKKYRFLSSLIFLTVFSMFFCKVNAHAETIVYQSQETNLNKPIKKKPLPAKKANPKVKKNKNKAKNNTKNRKNKKPVVIDPKIKDPQPPAIGGNPTFTGLLGSLAGSGVGALAGAGAGGTVSVGTDGYTGIPYSALGSIVGSTAGSLLGSVGSVIDPSLGSNLSLVGSTAGTGIGTAVSSLQGTSAGLSALTVLELGLGLAGYNLGNASADPLTKN